jgi:hypothetical protein
MTKTLEQLLQEEPRIATVYQLEGKWIASTRGMTLRKAVGTGNTAEEAVVNCMKELQMHETTSRVRQ